MKKAINTLLSFITATLLLPSYISSEGGLKTLATRNKGDALVIGNGDDKSSPLILK